MSDLPVSSFSPGSPAPTDLLYLVKNNSGTYASNKATVAQMDDSIRHASRFSGTNAGAQIRAAILDLPSSGGVVDARGITGAQTITSDIFAGVTVPVDLWLGAATFTTSTYITIPSNCTIRGMGRDTQILASIVNLPYTPDAIGAASGILYVPVGASHVVIRDLWVKGAYTGTGTSSITFGIRIAASTINCQVLNCFVTNNSWSGIYAEGSRHLIEGNYTEHNAVDGIEFFAKRTRIIGNMSYDDAAAASTGAASIEILFGADHATVIGNISDTSNAAGIQISGGGTAANGVLIQGNQIYSPAKRGIYDASGATNIRIVGNFVDTPQTSDGYGIYMANSTRFTVADNIVEGTTTGSGPSGIEIAGTCNHGIVKGNQIHGAWINLVLSGSSGATGTIIVTDNHTYGAGGGEYTNASSGAFIKTFYNSFGATAFDSAIPGINNGSDAAAGVVGEYLCANLTLGSAISLTDSVAANVISISLTAGDWDVTASIVFNFGGSTSYSILQAGISQTSATLGNRGANHIFVTPAEVPTNITDMEFPLSTVRFSLSSTTTIYLVTSCHFSVSTLAAYGMIRARRVR